MATFLIDLPPQEMERRLGDALRVYVDAMRYPKGTESQRAAMWLEHTRRSGWQAVAAVELATADATHQPSVSELGAAPLVGIAYGYPGAPGQWWQQQVILGLQRSGFPPHAIERLMNSYFELTELHIHPRAQGRGVGEALARRLLAGRPKPTSCSPLRRPTVKPTGPGGCIAGWVSPTSSAATTSSGTPGRSRSWAARCRSSGAPAVSQPGG